MPKLIDLSKLTPAQPRPIRILFVCLGNICRSPVAEGVFRHQVKLAGLSDRFCIASAGTGGWHEGEPPDGRMCSTATRRGVDITAQRARALRADDLSSHDHILVMDRDNLANARKLARTPEEAARVVLFRQFDPQPEDGQVPDPYYGGSEGFDRVFDIVDRTSRALLAHLRQTHQL
jgi:protein-tyrosine phosphatase